MPCKRRPAKGRTRCKLHGGASTGPTSAEGRARCAEAATTHGGFARSDSFREALRAKFPELYDDAGGDPGLGRELAFLRARLASLAVQGASVPEDAVLRCVAEVRKLAATMAAMSAQAALTASPLPPGELPRLRLELTVVDPLAEREEPMDAEGAAPDGAVPTAES